MTDDDIREAGAAAVADFPPLPDELVARIGAILADLDKETLNDPRGKPASPSSDTKAA